MSTRLSLRKATSRPSVAGNWPPCANAVWQIRTDSSALRVRKKLHAAYAETDKARLEAQAVSATVAGRIMLRRVMGRASFITLQDGSGRIQCYLRSDDIGASAYADFRELYDIGDIVGVVGTLMRTNKGELTVAAATIRMLTKALRPLPEQTEEA